MMSTSNSSSTGFLHLDNKLSSCGLRVIRKLGSGSFASVYHVLDKKDREYALKIITPTSESSAESQLNDERFETERRAHLLTSDHPNVVTVHDAFVVDGLRCLLMDLYSGGTLLEHASQTSRFWRDDDEIKRVFLQLIDAVSHCHSLGVSHRDLKPENILVSPTGENFFIADFGLATSRAVDVVSDAGSRPYKAPGVYHFFVLIFAY